MSGARIYFEPITICDVESVYDQHDTPGDRTTLQAERARALVASGRAMLAASLSGDQLVAAERALERVASAPTNPQLVRIMKACGVTAANVREHGPKQGYAVMPDLRALAEETDEREAAERKAR